MFIPGHPGRRESSAFAFRFCCLSPPFLKGGKKGICFCFLPCFQCFPLFPLVQMLLPLLLLIYHIFNIRYHISDMLFPPRFPAFHFCFFSIQNSVFAFTSPPTPVSASPKTPRTLPALLHRPVSWRSIPPYKS